MSMLLHWLLGFCLWFSPLKSAPTVSTYAVVVGISDYEALSYNNGDLRFADRDARQMVQFLQSKAGGDVPSSHIRLLLNGQATYANIQQALALFKKAQAGDRIIFYFSGHGSTNCFIAYDALSKDGSGLISYGALKAAFHASQATTKLCIADACLSGGMTQSSRQRSVAQALSKGAPTGNQVAMLLASRSTESAIEAGQLSGGAFTHFLLKGLQGQADRDHNQIITIRELHQYVSRNVRQITRDRQAPVFYGRFSDDLALSYL